MIIEHGENACRLLLALLARLSRNFMTYSAKIFVEDFRDRLARTLPEQAPEIAWRSTWARSRSPWISRCSSARLSEFFKNAFHFAGAGRASRGARRRRTGQNLSLELRESEIGGCLRAGDVGQRTARLDAARRLWAWDCFTRAQFSPRTTARVVSAVRSTRGTAHDSPLAALLAR